MTANEASSAYQTVVLLRVDEWERRPDLWWLGAEKELLCARCNRSSQTCQSAKHKCSPGLCCQSRFIGSDIGWKVAVCAVTVWQPDINQSEMILKRWNANVSVWRLHIPHGRLGGLLSCTSAGRQTAKIVINASVGEENPTINAWGDDVDHNPTGYTEICWRSHICHTCSGSYRIWRRKLAVRETPTQNEKEILDFAGSHQTSDYVNECKRGEVSLSHSWWCGPGELPL